MIEDELRAVFARQEDLAPPVKPVALAIDTGYRRRRRRRLAWRAGGAAAVAAGLLAVPAVVAGWNRPAGGPPLVTAARPSASAAIGTAAPSAAPVAGMQLNLLLLSVDDTTASAEPVTMVVHVTADGDRAYLIAVDAPDGVDLRAAYRSGGVGAAGQAVVKSLGEPFDAAVAVTLSGLGRMIDTLGGIDFCPDGGCRHFSGPAAIAYLRQQPAPAALSMALAVLLRVASITDPQQLTELAIVGGQDYVLDDGGRPLPALLARFRGLRQLIEVSRPKSPTESWARFKALFTGDADGYLASQPPATGS